MSWPGEGGAEGGVFSDCGVISAYLLSHELLWCEWYRAHVKWAAGFAQFAQTNGCNGALGVIDEAMVPVQIAGRFV